MVSVVNYFTNFFTVFFSCFLDDLHFIGSLFLINPIGVLLTVSFTGFFFSLFKFFLKKFLL